MDEEIFDSIVDMTKNQGSDEFGISVVSTIASIVPNAIVALFVCNNYPWPHYRELTTLSAKKDESGIKQYLWDIEVPEATKKHLDKHFNKLLKLTVYQTVDGVHHTFIPIYIENIVTYAIDISSETRFSDHLDSLLAITKVCQNFYTILNLCEKDSLTGLYNRRTYDSKISSLLNKQQCNQMDSLKTNNGKELRVIDEKAETWLAIIDIDFFKKINDKYGHIYGDEVLLTLSQLMQQSFRLNDLIFRFGGEEFVVIFEPIKKEHAEEVLNKFKSIVSNHHFPMIGHITISCGFALLTKNRHPKTVFEHADKALYYAKEHGRNRVCNFETLIKEKQLEFNIEEGDIELF